jgi:hypothetical protein
MSIYNSDIFQTVIPIPGKYQFYQGKTNSRYFSIALSACIDDNDDDDDDDVFLKLQHV